MTPAVSTLGNGFTVATLTVPGVSTAAVGLYVDVGARHEAAADNGLAHFLEHMVFKGTRTRSARAIAEAIEDAGGSLNAWTARDVTAFHARTLASDVELGVELIADLVRNPRFDADDIEREREVVLSELGEARDTPDDLVWDVAQALAFPDQPLGRAILGDEGTLAAMDAAGLNRWLATHYRGAGSVLAAAGAVDHAALVRQAEGLFGDLAAEAGPVAEAGVWRGGSEHVKKRSEQAHIVLGFAGPGIHDPGYFATQLFATAAGGGMSSRLFQELREERGLAYSIGASHSPYAETGLFSVSMATQPRDAAQALDLSRATLAATAATLSPAELARAKAQLKASLLFAMEDMGGLSSWLGQRWLSHRAFIDVPALTATIDAVPLEAVRAAGAALLAGAQVEARVGPKRG
ncbi:M16 family metallopeptidase [Sandaracinobacteroides saxicola]|uniref:Insulinase family protein n=1 Tax=Sandaracinobacteroides saxicola TaxID=2759707 RepID=A0A7G5IGZ1_9SPHN|nr:pitrilysin family protein [Sandaracinobacteroides saxicola]QMW22633.1 insulinase family protein [Sandaracinobacteroides saxicola]